MIDTTKSQDNPTLQAQAVLRLAGAAASRCKKGTIKTDSKIYTLLVRVLPHSSNLIRFARYFCFQESQRQISTTSRVWTGSLPDFS